ncbi:MAG: serine/threonine protein kinase [Nevskia sp.]|nr:serine/threonine protein kinase [Nevskia sp.]
MFAPVTLPENSRIDNFRILRRIGRGGFGITYVAAEYAPQDAADAAEAPSREVVVKEFFPQHIARRENGHTVSAAEEVEGAGQAFRNGIRAFLNEAKAIMTLEHDNIVHIHRVLEANGTAYFTMPFLRGETLRALLKREGSLSEERARRFLLPVLGGLAYAHAKGVLHRDLKPDNIMIRESDGRAVLIDFGSARMQAATDATQYTRLTDLVAYTPGYAALEQYARATSSNQHGPYTDVYGIAAVLYETVTGRCPPESAQRAAEVYGGRADPLTPASALLLDAPGYSRAFLAAIDWGLEIAGQDRPASANEFRDALNGRRPLPEKTLQRLEGHGVPTDPFTVVPEALPATARDVTLTQGQIRRAAEQAPPPVATAPAATGLRAEVRAAGPNAQAAPPAWTRRWTGALALVVLVLAAAATFATIVLRRPGAAAALPPAAGSLEAASAGQGGPAQTMTQVLHLRDQANALLKRAADLVRQEGGQPDKVLATPHALMDGAAAALAKGDLSLAGDRYDRTVKLTRTAMHDYLEQLIAGDDQVAQADIKANDLRDAQAAADQARQLKQLEPEFQ